MTILSPEEQIERGFATQCETTDNCEGFVVLTELERGWATWECTGCGQLGFSLEGDDE